MSSNTNSIQNNCSDIVNYNKNNILDKINKNLKNDKDKDKKYKKKNENIHWYSWGYWCIGPRY